MKQPTSYLLPDLALLFAATMWGLFWYPLRLFDAAGLPAIWVTLVAFLAASLVGLMLTFRSRHEYLQQPAALIWIGLTAGWCNAAFLVSVVEGNAIKVVLLFYLSPIWTVILGHYFLKELISHKAKLIFVFAFSGAMVMLWDPSLQFPWPSSMADWLALSAGFTFALSNVLIRKFQNISIPVKTTSSWLGCIVISIVWIVIMGPQPGNAEATVWLLAVVMGLLGIVFMSLAVQYGITHMPVYRSAIILLFEIIVTAVTVYWWANETLVLREWIGGIMIGVSAWLIAKDEKQTCKIC